MSLNFLLIIVEYGNYCKKVRVFVLVLGQVKSCTLGYKTSI